MSLGEAIAFFREITKDPPAKVGAWLARWVRGFQNLSKTIPSTPHESKVKVPGSGTGGGATGGWPGFQYRLLNSGRYGVVIQRDCAG